MYLYSRAKKYQHESDSLKPNIKRHSSFLYTILFLNRVRILTFQYICFHFLLCKQRLFSQTFYSQKNSCFYFKNHFWVVLSYKKNISPIGSTENEFQSSSHTSIKWRRLLISILVFIKLLNSMDTYKNGNKEKLSI